MIGLPLSERVRQVRQVEVSDELGITVSDEAGSYFPARRIIPTVVDSAQDGAPRDNLGRSKLVWGSQDLAAADRIEIYGGMAADDVTYELLQDPREIRTGGTMVGQEAEILPVTSLYPHRATLQELDGTVVKVESEPVVVPLAVYLPNEASTDRGSYDGYLGDAPVEFEEQLTVNSQLALGARVFRIEAATTDFANPHISLRLKT